MDTHRLSDNLTVKATFEVEDTAVESSESESDISADEDASDEEASDEEASDEEASDKDTGNEIKSISSTLYLVSMSVFEGE